MWEFWSCRINTCRSPFLPLTPACPLDTKCMYWLQKHAICMASKICIKKKALFSKRIIIYHVAFWKTGFVLSSFLLQSYFIFYCKPHFCRPEFESGKDLFSCCVWVKGSDEQESRLTQRWMFLKTWDVLLFWLKICCRPEIPAYWWRNMKCFSSTLPLNSRSSSLARRQIVNPHCEAASGRALGPYFRGQIHHVWCGWCSHNSSLTGVMFAGIIQHSINTRAWKKYGGFIKTVNRKSKKKRHAGFPWPRGMCYYCSCHLLMTKEMPYRNRKHIYWNRSRCQSFFLINKVFIRTILSFHI